MLANYAVVLRRSAVVTAPAALAMIAVSAVIGGAKGLLGAVLGVALVAAFFGISALIVTRVGRTRPQAAMGAAVASYIVKVLLVLFFVARFSGTTAFNGKLFGLTAIACILVWSAAQAVISMRLKVLYVEPEASKLPGAGPEADAGPGAAGDGLTVRGVPPGER